MRVSEYRGIEMYTDEGDYFGGVKGVVLDPNGGVVSGLAFRKEGDNWRAVPYDRVRSIGDTLGAPGRTVPNNRQEKHQELYEQSVSVLLDGVCG